MSGDKGDVLKGKKEKGKRGTPPGLTTYGSPLEQAVTRAREALGGRRGEDAVAAVHHGGGTTVVEGGRGAWGGRENTRGGSVRGLGGGWGGGEEPGRVVGRAARRCKHDIVTGSPPPGGGRTADPAAVGGGGGRRALLSVLHHDARVRARGRGVPAGVVAAQRRGRQDQAGTDTPRDTLSMAPPRSRARGHPHGGTQGYTPLRIETIALRIETIPLRVRGEGA